MKKITEIEKIKSSFYIDDDGNPKIENYGKFMRGLTVDEIYNYIRARSGKMRITGLYKKFVEIAGVNTMSCTSCKECGHFETLMYRHDVLRFCDVLFGVTTSTYFD